MQASLRILVWNHGSGRTCRDFCARSSDLIPQAHALVDRRNVRCAGRREGGERKRESEWHRSNSNFERVFSSPFVFSLSLFFFFPLRSDESPNGTVGGTLLVDAARASNAKRALL